MSSKTTWDSGTRAAPNTPCKSRAATISASEFAMPHSNRATVKPPMATKKICFCPKRSTSHPVRRSGDGRGHDVGGQYPGDRSWDADSVPCMCGNATFAMLCWSRVCMIVASMMDNVIMDG